MYWLGYDVVVNLCCDVSLVYWSGYGVVIMFDVVMSVWFSGLTTV